MLDLGRKVTVEEDPAIPVETAFVTVETTDGGRFETHTIEARGTMARPMSDAELEAKFHALADHGAPAIGGQQLIHELWNIEREPDIARIVKLTGSAEIGLGSDALSRFLRGEERP